MKLCTEPLREVGYGYVGLRRGQRWTWGKVPNNSYLESQLHVVEL